MRTYLGCRLDEHMLNVPCALFGMILELTCRSNARNLAAISRVTISERKPPMKIATCFVFLLLSMPAYAATLPDGPQPKTEEHSTDRRNWIVGTVALGASIAADFTTTAQARDRGAWEMGPPRLVIGHRPANHKIILFSSVEFAATSFMLWKTEHSRRAWLRWTGRRVVLFLVVNHTRLAAFNSGSCKSITCYP